MDIYIIITVTLLICLMIQGRHCRNIVPISGPAAVARGNGSIPRIMHHIYWPWSESSRTNAALKTSWSRCRQTCLDKTPQYEHMMWDDVMIEALMVKHYPWLYPTYKSYPYHVQRSDAARYMLLYHFGGIYIDMDDCCLSSLDRLVVQMELSGSTVLVPEGRPFGLGTDIIISAKHSDFMNYVLGYLPRTNRWYVLPYLTEMMGTGTLYLTSRYNEYLKLNPEFKYILLNYELKFNMYIERDEMQETWFQWDGLIIGFIYKHTYFDTFLIIVLFCIVCLKRKRRHFLPLRFLPMMRRL